MRKALSLCLSALALAACSGAPVESTTGATTGGARTAAAPPEWVPPPSTTWHLETSGTTGTLRSVWGSGPTDVWVAGNDGLFHSTGNGVWTLVPTGRPEALTLVWGTGPDNIFVGTSTGALLHSSDLGHTFTVVATFQAAPVAMFGSCPLFLSTGNALYRAEDHIDFAPVSTAIGSNFTGPGGDFVFSIWIAGLVPGAIGARSDDDGDTWTKVSLNGFGRVGTASSSIEGTWSRNDDVYVFGGVTAFSGGLQKDVSNGLVERSTDLGRTWTHPVGTNTEDYIQAVWGPLTAQDLFAVGTNGVVLHSANGTDNFTVDARLTTATLRAVWGANVDDVYAVGDAGTIVHSR